MRNPLLALRQPQLDALTACDVMESYLFEDCRQSGVRRYHKIASLRSFSDDPTHKLPLKVSKFMPEQQHSFVTAIGLHNGIAIAEPEWANHRTF